MDAADVLIVGGGLSGLACAVALADRGLKPIVLERDRCLGGRAISWTHAPTGDRVDIGPHVLLNEYRNFLAFLSRLGTAGDITWQPRKVITIATPHGRLTLRHRPLPQPLSLVPDLLRARDLDLRDFWSNNRATLAALQFGEERVERYDSVSGLDFLRESRCSEAMIDWFWRFACMAVMNTPVERVSAAAMLRVHGFMIGHRGIHFGFPAIGLGDLYTEQAAEVIGGAGGQVHLGHEVVRLEMGDGYRAVCEEGVFGAPRCVLALPPAELGRLVPGLAQTEAFEPSPYVSTYLWFDRRITAENFWSLLWAPTRLYYDFYDLANIRPSWRGRGSVIGCNLIFSHRAHGMSDEALVGAAVREIEEFAPAVREAKLLHAEVHHIPMAIPLPGVGTEMKRPRARTAHRGLFLAGDWTRTGLPSSMEGATLSGHRAAEEILHDLGRPESLVLPPREPDGLAWVARRLTSRA